MDDLKKLPTIVVPARLASTRLPKKLLREVRGKPLILWTAERLRKVAPEFDLHFAVDGKEIGSVLESNGFSVIETDPSLASGTDRIAAANKSIKSSMVINVQADEPLLKRDHIINLTRAIQTGDVAISTLAVPLSRKSDFLDPNHVKVVTDQKGFALYFSRSCIPFLRDNESDCELGECAFPPLKHIGVYAYQADFLETFSKSPQGNLEKSEKLEQLRALELGFKIKVSVTEHETVGIDTPKDLANFESKLVNDQR